MQPAGSFRVSGSGHGFGNGGGEGDDVVLHLLFDLVNSFHLEAGVLAQQGRGLEGYNA